MCVSTIMILVSVETYVWSGAYIPGFVILGNESNLCDVQFMDFSNEKRKLEEKQRSVSSSNSANV